jgi:predicted transport protein
MPTSVDEMAANLIKNLEKTTGKPVDEWIRIARESGETQHMKILKYLQDNYGLTYGYANTVATLARQGDQTPPAADDLVTAQYTGKENLLPIYNAILSEVGKFGKDIEVSPKKSYVSLRRSKQFGIIQPSTKTRVDIGIKMKEVDPTGRLENAGSWNSMVSHRVQVTDISQVDDELIGWLKIAYQAA